MAGSVAWSLGTDEVCATVTLDVPEGLVGVNAVMRIDDAHLSPGDRPAGRRRDHRRLVAAPAHRDDAGRLGQAVRRQHGVDAEFGPQPFDEPERDLRRARHHQP